MTFTSFTNPSDDAAYLLVSVPKKGKGGEEIHEIFFAEGDRNSARERAYNVRDEFARERGDFFWEVEAVESGDTFEVEEQTQRSSIRPEDRVKVAIKHLAFVLVWVLAALALLGILRLPM